LSNHTIEQQRKFKEELEYAKSQGLLTLLKKEDGMTEEQKTELRIWLAELREWR